MNADYKLIIKSKQTACSHCLPPVETFGENKPGSRAVPNHPNTSLVWNTKLHALPTLQPQRNEQRDAAHPCPSQTGRWRLHHLMVPPCPSKRSGFPEAGNRPPERQVKVAASTQKWHPSLLVKPHHAEPATQRCSSMGPAAEEDQTQEKRAGRTTGTRRTERAETMVQRKTQLPGTSPGRFRKEHPCISLNYFDALAEIYDEHTKLPWLNIAYFRPFYTLIFVEWCKCVWNRLY